MENFLDGLGKALGENQGRVTLQQATDLLPSSQKHRVMYYLVGAKNSGRCNFEVKRDKATNETSFVVINPRSPVAGGD